MTTTPGQADWLDVAVVVIGRNEGPRLERALTSAREAGGGLVVYVDSGSSDSSVALARSLDCEVVELDPEGGFTAARGRNAGVQAAIQLRANLRFVQFLDGDCELDPKWLSIGLDFLLRNQGVGAVCGQRREVRPDSTIYNLVTDREWRRPTGETHMFAGDALVRLDAFQQAGGFRANMIAGEEPEFCIRLRRQGWRIMRLACPMTRHDAGITRFSQWWRRQVRSGHAYAEIVALHAGSLEPYWVRRVLSIVGWTATPAVGIAALPFVGAWSAPFVLAPGVLWLRILLRSHPIREPRAALGAATFFSLGKLAESQGVLTFLVRRVFQRAEGRLIEYKQS